MDQDEALANEAEKYKKSYKRHSWFQRGGFKLRVIEKPEYIDPNAETVAIKKKKRSSK